MIINIRANPADITLPAVPVVMPNFIVQLRKDVINLPKAERKRLIRELIATSTGLLLVLAQQTALAAPPDAALGPDIPQLFGYLIRMVVVCAVGLAIVLIPVAGIWNMFNQSEAAQKWTQNIVKGFGQAMLGPVAIISIVFLCHLLFGGTGGFVDPWIEVSKFFK